MQIANSSLVRQWRGRARTFFFSECDGDDQCLELCLQSRFSRSGHEKKQAKSLILLKKKKKRFLPERMKFVPYRPKKSPNWGCFSLHWTSHLHTLKFKQKCWQEEIGREEPVRFATGWENLCKANWVIKWLWANVSCVLKSELLLLLLLSVKVGFFSARSRIQFLG